MTQEDKMLLVKDLSSRLPYAVHVQHISGVSGILHDISIRHKYDGNDNIYDAICYTDFLGDGDSIAIEHFKPYLFPLSSITEGQKDQISQLLLDTKIEHPHYEEDYVNLLVDSVKQTNALINYCLASHLDINDLIEKGLAIDATGLNIY